MLQKYSVENFDSHIVPDQNFPQGLFLLLQCFRMICIQQNWILSSLVPIIIYENIVVESRDDIKRKMDNQSKVMNIQTLFFKVLNAWNGLVRNLKVSTQ
jgi:hypothetical protein